MAERIKICTVMHLSPDRVAAWVRCADAFQNANPGCIATHTEIKPPRPKPPLGKAPPDPRALPYGPPKPGAWHIEHRVQPMCGFALPGYCWDRGLDCNKVSFWRFSHEVVGSEDERDPDWCPVCKRLAYERIAQNAERAEIRRRRP